MKITKVIFLLSTSLAANSVFAVKEVDRLDCTTDSAISARNYDGSEIFKGMKSFQIFQNHNKNYAQIVFQGKSSGYSFDYSRGRGGFINLGDSLNFEASLRPVPGGGLLMSRNVAKAYKNYSGKYIDGRDGIEHVIKCELRLDMIH